MMKTYMTRLFTVLMLAMVSMGAWADIDVQIANDGKFDGGTIKYVGQTKPDEKGFVTVTITVAPDKDYTIKKNNITVVSTYPPSDPNARTRTPEIAENLTLYFKGSADADTDDPSAEREYTFNVPSGFGAWVKEAEFQLKDDDSKGGGNRSVPFVPTTEEDITKNTQKYYLIQSIDRPTFYAIPNSSDDGAKVSTTSIPNANMRWCFVDAGSDSDHQYYYIVNSTGRCLYRNNDSNDGILIKKTYADLSSLSDDELTKYKFYLTQTGSDYFIQPKGFPGQYLNKRGGNTNYSNGYYIKSSTYNDSPSVWNFVAVADVFWPQPFTPSVGSDKHFYKFQNKTSPLYYLSILEEWATVNSADNNKNVWYLVEAGTDATYSSSHYYFIVNASTEKYLYYTGGTGNDVAKIMDYNASDADKYKFLVVDAACKPDNTNYETCYTIVPKLRQTNYNNKTSFAPMAVSDDSHLLLKSNRSSSGYDANWVFVATEYSTKCDDPTIIYSSTTGKISITTTTTDAIIHYTDDGTTAPSSSVGTLYEGPFDVTGPITIKAIATKTGSPDSEVTTVTFDQVATPTIQINGSNAVSITCGTEGAAIYYTLDGSTPTTSSTPYTEPLTENVSGVTIKAIAVKEGMINSAIASNSFTLQCAKPVFTKNGNNLTITCVFPSNASIYYTLDSSEPSSSSTLYEGAFTVALHNVIKAIAIAPGYDNSLVATKTIHDDLSPNDDGKYLINSQTDFETFVDMANEEEGASYHYVLKTNVDAGSEITQPFTGIFEADADEKGNFYKISGLDHALFNSINGGTVKNVILDGVNIQSGTNVGAIANEMIGSSDIIASIYNCGILSGGVNGSGYVGGLVGQLGKPSDDNQSYARVINCFSYADVNGGTDKGGIVGYNSFASTSSDIRTMVMNCMFYGDISSGGNISPIYGGVLIDNQKTASGTGLNNYNYYRYESDYSYDNLINKYNNALAAEEEYLNRFEFYRQMMNSNKKLAAYYATGSADNADQKMAKWVLETADRSNGNPYPYPILKPQDKYPSIINYDTNNLADYAENHRKEGCKTGELSVTINYPDGGWTNAPTGAKLLNQNGNEISTSRTISLVRTDKDEDHFNFNYDKVQLPYYNDYGTKNYTGNKVVTGWKITGVTIGTGDDVATQGSYSASDSWGGYNFADRKTYAKDLYSVSGRVFSQGAYFDVPYGATAITIEPYWGNAVYISDEKLDVVYNSGYSSPTDILESQFTFSNGTATGAFNGQNVYSNISTALNTLSGSTVYDNALVLVGNRHMSSAPSASKHYTIMSVDEDHDNEPDYSLIYHHSGRANISPIRFDFLNIMGTAQAQMPREGVKFFNVGIFNPTGWFEVTNTTLIYFSQIEYDNGSKAAEPLILLGGIVDQITSNHAPSGSGTTTYIHLGSNVRFKQFSNGCHSDRWQFTKHIPISVTGGDYQEFYLSGMYRPDAIVNADNAECYISSGRFGELAGAGQQMINGNVQWQIYNADIDNFYGGGINAANPITGNITVNLFNSHIGTYCGGPKFGNMQQSGTDLSYTYAGGNDGNTPTQGTISITGDDRIVTTQAKGCTFGTYYGAGYGGTSFNRVRTRDKAVVDFPTWQTDYTGKRGNYIETNNGIATDFDYDFFVYSTGETGGRFYVKYASLSTAQTNNVTSTLTNCIVNGNVYGGGKLGRVAGKATTTLNGCTVNGDVFGAGYSGALDPVKVRDGGFGGNPVKYPSVNTNSGMFEDGEFSGTTDYIWKQHTLTNNASNIITEGGKNYIYTDVDLAVLGQVDNAELTIQSGTTVKGSVYGGGEEANVNEDTEVTVNGGTIGTDQKGGYRWGNVYGGGKGKIVDDEVGDNPRLNVNSVADLDAGLVKGNTNITINGGTILHNVYGGGAIGSVGTFTRDADGMPTDCAANTGQTTVTINGGTIGHDRKDTGMVDGSSRGWEGNASAEGSFLNQLAWINSSHVIIGSSTSDNEDVGPSVLGSVYGGGENGHNFTNAEVTIYKGTIGQDKTWECGNVYGAGCGTDTYTVGESTTEHHNPLAGVVYSTTSITINGGNVLRNVYGGGAMGSVGKDTDTSADNGKTTITVSGGHIGTASTGDYGYVFGGPKGNIDDTEVIASVKKSQVTIDAYADIKGSVFGGGEAGIVKGSVDVNIAGGSIAKDVYGGGALADTNINNWDPNGDGYEQVTGLTVGTSVVTGYYTKSSEAYTKITTEGTKAAEGTFYYKRIGTWADGKYDANTGKTTETTTVNLLGGTISGDAYGGGLGRKEYGTEGQARYESAVEAMVYGDVTVKLNEGKTSDQKGCVVNRVFGCNNLNGTPKGKVNVHVYGTQKSGGSSLSDKTKDTYDVQAVYGGGNLAKYEPVDAKSTDEATLNAARPEVLIEGCSVTSIKQVYGGGNAAPAPATYVEVRSAYEIDEVFGGGNGYDNYSLQEGNATVWYQNPGANVGYYTYASYPKGNGQGTGTSQTDPYIAVETSAYAGGAEHKEARLAAADIQYGSGIATLVVKGGTIHTSYGGSNSKGNVRAKLVSTYTAMIDDCPMAVGTSYGGGKNAYSDADADVSADCAKGMKEMFGGTKDADFNGDINLKITNGSSLERVFGGNNTSGAVNGSITVTIEEGGCEPIRIDELYLGGYKADYSVFGYNDNKTPKESGEQLYADPRLNVISATYIGKIFGGGYQAKLVGNPHINVNMEKGMVIKSYAENMAGYSDAEKDDSGNMLLPIGTIGTIYGGGNLADVVGDTYVDIKSAKITEDVFGGGNQANVTGNTQVTICAAYNESTQKWESVAPGAAGVTIEGTHPEGGFGRGVFGGGNQGNVNGDSYVYFGGGAVNQTIYGGGCVADVKGNTHVTMLDGYVFDGVCGGGLKGSVGDFNLTDGKPTSLKTANTGKCTTVITGGQVGPVTLALEDTSGGMTRVTNGKSDPVAEGWVWGAGRGIVEDPSVHTDTHNKTYVYETDVTIGGTAFILASVIGGGEFGRVLHDTNVTIQDHCQIGVGEGQYNKDENNNPTTPKRYTDGSGGIHGNVNQFVAPTDTDTPITSENALAPCSHFPYGKNLGTTEAPNWVYYTYDPYADEFNNPYSGGSTNNAADGKTWIGCVFGGGSGYFPYRKEGGSGYDWVSSAGLVEGNANVTITGGHILTNVYGGNEYTSVNGKCTVKMSGGTIGVPRTLAEVKANPTIGHLFGAGKGDPRSHFNGFTNAGSVEVEVSGGIIYGSVYGGSEDGHVLGNVSVTVEKNEDNNIPIPVIGTWGASFIDGNVYGGGMGTTTNVAAGLVKGNTNITISDGKILHNIYGGGAYGSVGTFAYDENNVITGHTANTGKATISITGGTIGTTGNENGMVFGSSRGDVGATGEIHDKLAWVYDTEVKIGTSGSNTGPQINGSIYGGGENGHNYHNADVYIYSGTVGIAEGVDLTYTENGESVTNGGAAYPYRGNVYGGGCGTDKYYSDRTQEKNDGNGDTYNPLAGIVYGDATITMTGGTVVHNVYGAGAMGSVGKTVTTNGVTTTTGGLTTISISGGTIGVSGTVGDGNVFGAARGNLSATGDDLARVRETNVTVSNGTVKGNVYGGGQLGDVGTIDKTDQTNYNYIWKKSDGSNNTANNNKITGANTNTGICTVTISGGTIGVENPADPSKQGNVFGGGKGDASTWWCERAIAYATNVSVTKGTVYGNVYGGGELGRVEDDAKVTIGTTSGTDNLTITGSVYGAGAGIKTHGYSALVRGNADVIVQGVAQVGGNVYGGGEIASVGRFHVVGGLPKNPQAGGTCTVKIQGNAKIGSSGIGHNVFGACKGVTPAYNNTQGSTDRSKSMQLYENRPKVKDPETGVETEKAEHTYWDYYKTYGQDYEGQKFVWVYYETEADYLNFLKTLALTSNTHVTIDGSSDVYGSVYGGGERGITLGGVDVNMTGGTVYEDVYGGGSLADSNTAMWDATNNTLHDYAELELIPGLSVVTGYYTEKSPETLITTEDAKATGTKYYAIYKTNVNLKGGMIKGDAYGGGLGRKEYGTEGQAGYESAVEAMVYGDVTVELNNNNNGGNADGSKPGCAVNRVFGCNNLNGTPKGKVNVHVYGTQKSGGSSLSDKTQGSYDVQAVYGGGNLAKYEPVDAKSTDEATLNAARPEVLIEGCGVTSIKQVYGGGNAASAPATYVEVRSAYEIDEVFGGGNGYDNYSLLEDGVEKWYQNPGANVGYYTYASYPTPRQGTGTQGDPYIAVETDKFSGGAEHKEARLSTTDPDAIALRYGSGIATLVVKGGTIHTSYGGSNSKGNVRKQLSSTYTAMIDDCAMAVGTSYGGGKNAYSDADAEVSADCAKGVKEMFGGSRDADFDGNINLTISNGSSLERVFGGNNTSGAVNGSITVTIKEGGCEPIRIGSLYAGGFLAPYSVYGYEKNTDGSYKTESVEYLDENNVVQTKQQRIPLQSGTRLYNDPRINVISATRIDNIFGGGYQAKLVGNPHINVNMEKGKISENYRDTYTGTPEIDGSGNLPIGTIGNIYGGGNMADIVGDTYVEIGTGTWVTSWDSDGNAVYTDIAPARNAATITGNVFGGGKGKADNFKCDKAMIGIENQDFGSTHVIIGNGTVGTLDDDGKLVAGTGNVYGGGEIGRVEKNTTVTIGLDKNDVPEEGTSAPVILGNVFGAGKGLSTHGYSALVRGNSTVTIQSDAKVKQSVYGGGEIASVGKYSLNDAGMPVSLANQNSGYCTVNVKDNAEIGPDNPMTMITTSGYPDDAGHVFGAGMGVLPYEEVTGGINGEPWRMKPGNVIQTFVADKYVYEEGKENPNPKIAYLRYIETLGLATQTYVTISDNALVKGSVYGGSMNGHVQHDTQVTIAGGQIGCRKNTTGRIPDNVWEDNYEPDGTDWECASWSYGVGENHEPPFAPYDIYDLGTDGKPKPATDGHTFYGNVFGGGSGYYPYAQDPDYETKDQVSNKSRKDLGYADGLWHRDAGSVGGNTVVNITGGHILTSVYGGNEQTDVGTYLKDDDGDNTITVDPNAGTVGQCVINMTGGTVGVPRTVAQMKAHPVTCYVFGAGKGDQRINFNKWTNVANTKVNISGNARIYGSTFGGGEDGHVIGDTETNIGNITIGSTQYTGDDVVIGTTGTSYVDGNVFGGGRGFSGDAQTAGTVGGNVDVNISNGNIYGSIYGGGRLASVGTQFNAPEDPDYGNFKEDDANGTYGHITINISGGTIGRDFTSGTVPEGGEHSGNVFGGSMGRLDLLDGTRNPIWPKIAQVKTSAVNIYGDAKIMRSVYGGGELGTVRDNAAVTIGGILNPLVTDGSISGFKMNPVKNDSTITSTNSDIPTIYRDVYGGGYGSEDRTHTVFTVKEPGNSGYVDNTYAFTPMQFAGCVGKNTFVHIKGGRVNKSVYGGGELASVGVINCMAEEVTSEPTADKVVVDHQDGTSKWTIYSNMVKHADIREENGKQVYYGFALSWPYEFNYVSGFDGATHVNITGGRIGLKSGETVYFEDSDYGDVCGGGKGKAGDYKDFVFCANVGSTEVNINMADITPEIMGTGDCVSGAVYGGAENGHVMRDTYLKLEKGLVGHSIYGGGSGKGKFSTDLLKIGSTTEHYTRDIYSITAGKVFGNTKIEMTGGYVVRNVYGGGNMGSVGKGNYSGGSDDYSAAGYGELPPYDNQKLWTSAYNSADENSTKDFPWHFLNSGKCTVKITGGTVGYIDPADPSACVYPTDPSSALPYGNVFGGCRGESAPNISETPRYLYSPEFFVGYANETSVEIGKADGTGPTIMGSVYGGGMDGHVRRDASVTIKGGEVGLSYDDTNKTKVQTSDFNNIQWLARGNVYGSGSGIGKYKYDFNYDNDTDDTVTYNEKETKEEDFSTSAGSVTRFTKVEIQGGTIHRNVYGGGSLSSIGAPKIPPITDNLILRDDNATNTQGKQTLNEVIISGGQIGDQTSVDANYGGHVFGGSRGDASLNSSTFSTSMFTKVNIAGGQVLGSVFGGGEVGIVKGSVAVNVTGGEVKKDVYGGGALANTNTSNWDASVNDGAGNWADATNTSSLYTTTVNLLGGTINDAYGGGLGQREGDVNGGTSDIEAIVFGDVNLNLNGLEASDYIADVHSSLVTGLDKNANDAFTSYRTNDNQGCVISGNVFGCNNINGTPKGHSKVHVFKTMPKEGQASDDYDVTNVFGGGNNADYVPADTKQATEVIIEGCGLTSIQQVYGGGNAAATPGTLVLIKGTKIIDEVFGGGNGVGSEDPTAADYNPGANVGYMTKLPGETDLTRYALGDGKSLVQLMAGTVHNAYGGSNSNGDIRGGSSVTTVENEWKDGDGANASCCKDLLVDHMFGGGKNANMKSGANIVLGCSNSNTWVKEIYAGAENANVGGNVSLTLTSGKYGRVFGGNKTSGILDGSITVNIEENGQCGIPLIIGELYGGGNKAAYSIYGYNADGSLKTSGDDPHASPVVNVRAFTSIGNIFGGGYGAEAEMYGSPTININETLNHKDNAENYHGNAYGGETLKFVNDLLETGEIPEGTTPYTVVLPRHDDGKIGAINNVFGGGNAAKVNGDTNVNIGTTATEPKVKLDNSGNPLYTDEAKTIPDKEDFPVKGADIRGNVYGGGNAAEVTGNTNVNIGKAVTTTNTNTTP